MTLKEALKNSENVRIRMFKSDFLEKFSYVHPLTPFIIFVPVVSVSLYFAATHFQNSWQNILMYFGIGLLAWSLLEYFLHRFIFHPPQTNEFFRKVYFYIHGIHHDAQDDASRLVMPPGVSIPLAVGIYFGFQALFGELFLPAFAGLVTGYMIYDYFHFASHFYAFKNPWFKMIKKNHMRHHNVAPNKNFGFTSPIWDIVFGSYYRVKAK